MMKTRTLLAACLLASTSPFVAMPAFAHDEGGASVATASPQQAETFDGMTYRLVGPFRGGRITTVSGHPAQQHTFYAGAASGGVWKTTDGGANWKPLWDHFPEASPSIGAIAVAPSDPDTIYVGTGEACLRGNVMVGNGIYKSTDGGKTWRSLGLAATKSIGRIIVDPKNPNRLFVAALGDPFGDNAERGAYRSNDGGETWEKVLFVNNKTGVVDISFDPSNSNVLYAGAWQVHRKPWIMESGGPGSALYKSTDGGQTWQKLSGNGLPGGTLGRIGVAPTSDPNRVYALIEAEKGGLYRTDDGGKTWQLINDDNKYRQRAWYYTHVHADPKDPDKVYVLNTGAYKSSDGGKSFKSMPVFHGDVHDLWINPENPTIMANANDGGANVSLNSGDSWTEAMNQPTAQFYHITVDQRQPYWIYGAQQDNSTIAIASASPEGPIGVESIYPVGGGESGYIAVWPRDPNIVIANSYGGQVTRYDRRTGQATDISPWARLVMGWAPKHLLHRAQWTAPLLFSPHDPDTLYHGNEVVWRTRDLGNTWQAISPDLTRNDKRKQEATGGPITKDTTSVETYGTVFTIAESPVQKDLIWAGTDDGLVQVTHNGGGAWSNVTPKAMPEWGTVSMIDADPRRAGSAYVAVDRHRLADLKPYAFRTDDFGKSWKDISRGIPADAYVHVVRADPARDGLLYAGTEKGIFVSFDRGDSWRPLQMNLPRVPIHDLAVTPNDLAVGTHGRAFWVLDDLSPVRQWQDDQASAPLHLYTPKAASRMRLLGRGAATSRFTGANPPDGAVIYYQLGRKADGPVKIELLDAGGKVLRSFTSKEEPAKKDAGTPAAPLGAAEAGARAMRPNQVTTNAGLNRFIWDMRLEGAADVARAPLWAGSTAGPVALPGHYAVRVTANGQTQSQPFEIVADPRLSITPDQLRQQYEFSQAVVAELDLVNRAILEIRNLHRAIGALGQGDAEVAAAAAALDAKASVIENTLIQTRSKSSQDPLNFPVSLNNMLAGLNRTIWQADGAPTAAHRAEYAELKTVADRNLGAWSAFKSADLAAFNALLARKGLTAVAPSADAEMKLDPFKPMAGGDDTK